MRLIGLAGRAGAGKDSVADVLEDLYGFRRFSFSDALYEEVADAFGVTIDSLKDRALKEAPTEALALRHCRDREFVACVRNLGVLEADIGIIPRSPRWVLQIWGTEYRREQDPDYWIRKAAATYEAALASGVAGLVNTSVRHGNEVDWLRSCGADIWHILRSCGAEPVIAHSSEAGIPRRAGDVLIINDGTLDDLAERVEKVMSCRGILMAVGW